MERRYVAEPEMIVEPAARPQASQQQADDREDELRLAMTHA